MALSSGIDHLGLAGVKDHLKNLMRDSHIMVIYIDLWAIGAVALAYAARIRNTLAYTARVRNSPGSHITSRVLWTIVTSSGPCFPTYRRSRPMRWLYNFVDRSSSFSSFSPR